MKIYRACRKVLFVAALATLTWVSNAKADLQQNEVVSLALPANDLAYSESSKRLYASVGSSGVGKQANSITAIDPKAGAISSSVFIGSEPNHLVAGSGGKFVYTSINNDTSVRRLNTVTGKAGIEWELNQHFAGRPPVKARQLIAVPNAPGSVAVLGTGYIDFTFGIWDHGVLRPKVVRDDHYVSSAAFLNETTLLGYNGYSSSHELRQFAVTAHGISWVRNDTLLSGFNNAITVQNGVTVASSGEEVDVASMTIKGRYEEDSDEFPLIRGGRIFYLSRAGITAYERATFRKIGFFPVKGEAPHAFTAWGTDGFGWIDGGKVVLARTNLVTKPVPQPSVLPTTRGIRPGVRVWDFPASDMVYEKNSNRLVASLPSSLGVNGNSVVVLNPRAGTTEVPIYAGSSPGKIAVSDDGVAAFVSLDGSYALRRVHLPNRRAMGVWPLGK